MLRKLCFKYFEIQMIYILRMFVLRSSVVSKVEADLASNSVTCNWRCDLRQVVALSS